MDNSDYLRKLASFEQIAAGLDTVANVLKIYYDSLVKAGFSDSQAMKLTVSYQKIVVNFAIATIGDKLNNGSDNAGDEDNDDEDENWEDDDNGYSTN
jgi:hypothetical protein